ncbi:NAD(P)-dependent oxidoreductase [Kineosporia sp. A_224]|uniref:NAD(P)-dependent oxidoreductase n=1 Tax=Kineosporia sp. A_224 TaxID=1962180 RepID=UPI000B4A8152|nr:NAD(P)-dependent oxidoreductase [Kineosporia sp. A_224]
MTSVGVIGLGKMGLPIARNLLERGFPVTGYRRTPVDELTALGGTFAGSPGEVAAASTVIISILPDVDALREVVLGPDGTAAHLRPGTVHIEMSTLDVDAKQVLRDVVRDRGGDMLDCPISGTPAMVAPRAATTFASGEPACVDAVRQVLDAISGPWVYAGAFGSGARLKYVANLLVAVHTVATAEALLLAHRSGLDLKLVQDAVSGSIAGSTIWDRRGPLVAGRTWTPAPGPIGTLHLILEQIEAQAGATGTTLPVFAAAKDLFDKAVAEGWSDLDIAAVHDQLSGQDPFQHDEEDTP